MIEIGALNFDKNNGLVVVVTQDATSGALLMVAHADREALERTIASGEMHYRSRSRGLWHKGATSGNTQRVVSLSADCDGDTVLARVIPAGPACHTGSASCFGDAALAADTLGMLDSVILDRARELARDAHQGGESASGSYTQRLLKDRNLRLKKIGEEAAELVLACADENKARSVEEAADLVYHILVALRSIGATMADLREELAARFT